MGVYKARRFSQSTKKLGIHDKVLMAAAEEVMQGIWGNDSNLLIVFYVQIMPDDFVMQLHRF